MELVDPSGERLVERRIPATPEDCHAIASAMAAVVERSLRTLGWTRGAPLPLSVRQTYVTETSGPTVQNSKPIARKLPRLVLGIGPSIQSSGTSGTSSGAAMNLLIEARVRVAGPLCLRLGGELLSDSDSQSVGKGTAHLTSRSFTAAPLAVFAFSPVELAGGPILLLGFDHASSDRLDQGGSGDRQRLALGAAIGFAVRLSPRWRLSAGLEGFHAALGADYVVNIDGKRTVVLSPSPWGGIAAAQLEFVAWP